jgi:hypothetical protein
MDELSRNNVSGKLFDVGGKLVKSITFLQPSIAYTLDLTELSPGVYSFVLESGDKKVVQKIIKK